MSLTTLCLPKMGESVMEAVVLGWCIKEGEMVREGTPLLEVATDKVDAEIPALYPGKIIKLLVSRGQVVAVGAPIALLEVDHSPVLSSTHETSPQALEAIVGPSVSPCHVKAKPSALSPSSNIRLSPLARHIAREYAIEPDELAKLASYTKDNRVTKDSLFAYLNKRISTHGSRSNKALLYPGVAPLEGDEVVQMDRVRQLIADRMVQSKQIAPHVTSFIRADVTELVAWRNQHKASFEEKYGVKLTYNPIFMAVIARALQLFPLLNAVVVDDKIVKRKHINIGFAVTLPNGNLLVPVIKQVEQLGLVSLAKEIAALIYKARSGTITPDGLAGASYTISNIGSFDNLMGTPIIVQPQVAILALGLIEKRPAVVDINGKESIAIRSELFLSHTYDHRIIDGSVGGGFLKYLASELASFVDNIVKYSFT